MGYRIALAVTLVLIGLVVLVERVDPELDLVGFFRRFWPAALVLVGIASLANLRAPTKAARAATFLVIAGALLMLVTAGLLPDRLRPYGWPIALIAIGTAVLVQQARRGERRPQRAVDRFFFIGHSRRIDRKWSESSLLVLFALAGGCELYFENSVGTPTRLDITAALSGIDIVVPRNWTVYVEAPVLGRTPVNQADEAASPDEADLRVHALCVLTGIVIRRA
jgi:4-amino-4-deoxy-L-arabinose transferase-like glycosyltransferase